MYSYHFYRLTSKLWHTQGGTKALPYHSKAACCQLVGSYRHHNLTVARLHSGSALFTCLQRIFHDSTTFVYQPYNSSKITCYHSVFACSVRVRGRPLPYKNDSIYPLSFSLLPYSLSHPYCSSLAPVPIIKGYPRPHWLNPSLISSPQTSLSEQATGDSSPQPQCMPQQRFIINLCRPTTSPAIYAGSSSRHHFSTQSAAMTSFFARID